MRAQAYNSSVGVNVSLVFTIGYRNCRFAMVYCRNYNSVLVECRVGKKKGRGKQKVTSTGPEEPLSTSSLTHHILTFVRRPWVVAIPQKVRGRFGMERLEPGTRGLPAHTLFQSIVRDHVNLFVVGGGLSVGGIMLYKATMMLFLYAHESNSNRWI